MKNKYLLRKCRRCGAECYGSLCEECYKKNKYGKLSSLKGKDEL